MKALFTIVIAFFCFSALAQKQIIFNSKNLPQADTTWVFAPKKLNKKQKVPTVILLHGYGGNYKQWNKIMNAQKYADEYGYILICPDGLFKSWYLNSPAKTDWQYETFFFDELLPKIKSDFPIDTTNLFITGLSMGGHGALWLFLKQPDQFKSAGSTSGGINLRDAIGKFGVPELLGNPDKDSNIWSDYSVIKNIDKLSGNKKEIIFDCGSSDFFYQSNNALKQKCDSLKINATYTSQPGSHNASYWKKSIKQQFEFFKTQVSSIPKS
ncbi:alpha/beta hydrolase [Pedobacter punctiformis]|uniref:Alpha/beta hydrolase-fold protein n=1 Tax=Pedobacter punctiformis TaxID=3004097 RepID=A0ABT4L612_9SPHI|nr:alpha/beta fold hydrolase [Pedobacter sp. HCMS5-2]MCZ4243122.1 alpha/beta hydrolase-fold protein [Pedobacter sp. HCMS5-2]